MENPVAEVIGPKHAPHRDAVRHGHQTGEASWTWSVVRSPDTNSVIHLRVTRPMIASALTPLQRRNAVDEFGETDRSHRKLAHRGSYERRVWVSPAR